MSSRERVLLRVLMIWGFFNAIVAQNCYKCMEVINIENGDHIVGNCDLIPTAARLKEVNVEVVHCDSNFCGLYSTIQNGE